MMKAIGKDRPKPVNSFSAENETENESHYFQLFFKSKSCKHYYTINIGLPNIVHRLFTGLITAQWQ